MLRLWNAHIYNNRYDVKWMYANIWWLINQTITLENCLKVRDDKSPDVNLISSYNSCLYIETKIKNSREEINFLELFFSIDFSPSFFFCNNIFLNIFLILTAIYTWYAENISLRIPVCKHFNKIIEIITNPKKMNKKPQEQDENIFLN